MRLEVRADNSGPSVSMSLQGYRQFGRHLDYYDDHADALRLEKSLIQEPPPARGKCPIITRRRTSPAAQRR